MLWDLRKRGWLPRPESKIKQPDVATDNIRHIIEEKKRLIGLVVAKIKAQPQRSLP